MAYKKYTPEFKFQVVLEVLREEKDLNAIATKYALSPNLVRNWKKEFMDNAAKAFVSDTKVEKEARRKEVALEKKNAKMLKTIGQLTVERDFLQECFRESGLPVPELDS